MEGAQVYRFYLPSRPACPMLYTVTHLAHQGCFAAALRRALAALCCPGPPALPQERPHARRDRLPSCWHNSRQQAAGSRQASVFAPVQAGKALHAVVVAGSAPLLAGSSTVTPDTRSRLLSHAKSFASQPPGSLSMFMAPAVLWSSAAYRQAAPRSETAKQPTPRLSGVRRS